VIYPNKVNKWIKYYIYFVLAYAIFIVFAHIDYKFGILLALVYISILIIIREERKKRGYIRKRY
jgi:hypothetical protein